MRRARRWAVAGLTAAALAAPAEARQDDAPTAPQRWETKLDFGFNGSTGNTRLGVLTTAAQVRHLITEEFQLEWNGRFRYGESEGIVIARNMRSVVTVDLYPDETVSPFVFGTIERDPFRRLRLRIDGGGGAKYTFVRDRTAEASLSAAALYSHDAFTPDGAGVRAPARSEARWSVRARGSRRFAGGIRIEHVTFYKPVWDQLDDYYVDAVTRLTAPISERLAIGIAHNVQHNATPPPDVLPTDQTIQATLTIQF